MPEITSANDAVDAARTAVAADVANVTSAIDSAIADMDQQLATLQERREELESALATVTDQIAAVESQRGALAAARNQVPGGGSDKGAASAGVAAPGDGDEYLEFDEDELSPDLPRSERIVTILERAGEGMNAADITTILNEFGDSTTAKIVGGTVSNLSKRGAVKKVSPGTYAAS